VIGIELLPEVKPETGICCEPTRVEGLPEVTFKVNPVKEEKADILYIS
jgi:hypothetical protein